MRKKLLYAAVAIIVLFVLSFLVLNTSYGKKRIAGYLVRYVKNQFGLTLKIGSFDYDWYPLAVRFEDLSVEGSDQKLFFSARSLTVSIPYSSFRSTQFLVREIVVDSPRFDLDHLPRFPSPSGGGKSFRIERMVVKSGEVIVSDRKFENINTMAIVDPEITTIPQLSARFGTADITGRGTLSKFKRYQFQYDVKGDASQIAEFSDELPAMSGSITAKGKLEGEGGDLTVSGHAEAASLMVPGFSPISVSADYKVSPKEETPLWANLKWKSLPWALLRKFYPELPSMGTRINGSMEYSGGKDLLKGSGAIQAQLEKDGSNQPPLTGNLQGRFLNESFELKTSNLSLRSTRAEFSGALSREEMRLNVRAASGTLSDLAFLTPKLYRLPGAYQFNGTLSGPYSRIQAKGKLVGASADLKVEATGSFTTGKNIVDLVVSGYAGDASIRKLLSSDVEGQVDFSGQVTGSFARPMIQANLSSSSLKVSGIEFGEANATLDSDGNLLNAIAHLPGISTNAEGNYRFASGKFELQAHLQDVSIDPFRPLLPEALKEYSGSLSAELTASGNLDQWKQSEATLMVQDAILKSNEIQIKLTPDSKLQLEKQTITLNVAAEMPRGTINLDGTVSLAGQHLVDLHASGETNANIISLWKPELNVNGPVVVDVFANGTMSKPDFSGTVRTDNFELSDPAHNLHLKQAKLLGEFSGTRVLLKGSGLLNDAELTLDGTVPFSRDKGEIHLDLVSFPVASLIPNSKVSGTVDVSADFQGLGFPYEDLRDGISRNSPLWDWNGQLAITPSHLKLGERELSAEDPLTVTLRNGVLELEAWNISSGQVFDLAARGSVRFDSGAIDGGLRLSVKVDLLSSLRADIQSNGPLSVYVNVGGTLDAPEYSGSVGLRGGSLRVPNFQLAFEHVDLYASFDKDHLTIETLAAQAGGGSITGGGEIYLRGKGVSRNIWVKGTNVGLGYPAGMRSQLDFNLNLGLAGKEFLLSGDINLLRSSYSDDIGLKNRLLLTLLSKRREFFQREYLKSLIKLSLKVRTVDNFRMNNNLGLIRASADLQLGGTLQQPRVSGRMDIRSGSRVYFMGRRYDVESGRIDFYGTTKLQPDLNITLATLVQDYNNNTFYDITLPIVGPYNKLEYRNPRSTPSLSNDQIYSLLLSGTTTGEGAVSPSVLFQKEMVAFLTGQIFFGAEQKFAQTFGLSRINVQQNLLATGNETDARLILGKDFGSSFSFSYSFPLSSPEEQTWILSYRYHRDFVFRTIRQEDSSVTASARQTILFGKGYSYKGLTLAEEEKMEKPRISKFSIINDSTFSDAEVRKKLKMSEGDLYDYWELQDNLDSLEKHLQDHGYLFPTVRVVEEDDPESNTVSLTVNISAGQRRAMSFTGAKVSKKQTEQFHKWWREGISENLVLGLIQENLLNELWREGYHQARVTQTTENRGEITTYAFEIVPGIKFLNVDILFTGNQQFNSNELMSEIIQFYDTQGEMISEAVHDFPAFKEKIEAAYVSKGLLQANPSPGPLSLDANAKKIIRETQISEGPYTHIAKIIISNGQQFPPELQSKLEVHPGDVLNLETLPENETTIRDYYESEGYRTLTLGSDLKRQEGTPDLVLTYDLKIGKISRIASIRIQGNEVTRTSLIESRLGFKAGDIVTDQKMAEAQKRLFDLGVFQDVDMTTDPAENEGEFDLVVTVVEGKKYELQYGPRYNTESGIGAEVNLVDMNFLGRAQRMSFYGRYDANQPVYRLDYSIPRTSGFWSNTLVSLFYQVQEDPEQGTFSDGTEYDLTLDTTTSALQFQQERRFKDVFRFLYGVQAGTSNISVQEVISSFDYSSIKGSFVTFGGALYMDTRDDPLNAKRGQFISVSAAYAPNFGTDIRYIRNFNQYFYYKRLGRIVWASGIRAGFLDAISVDFTLDERFQTGGSNTVRGFGTNDLTPQDNPIDEIFGGEAVFVFNQEIRFPIHKWLGGAVFYDGGNVYSSWKDFDPLNIRNTGGFGLRFDTPFIVLRLDLGFNFDPINDESGYVFHFGIGQAF